MSLATSVDHPPMTTVDWKRGGQLIQVEPVEFALSLFSTEPISKLNSSRHLHSHIISEVVADLTGSYA